MNIGFIGLGIMGAPMARRLHEAGHALLVYGRREISMQPLVERGCIGCGSPREIAERSEVIFVMVPDTPDVEAVVLGDFGVIEGAIQGAVVIDMSSIAPLATQRIALALAERGVDMLDAPVSGGEIGAIEGSLSIMVGGKQAVFERMRPLFGVLGNNVVHVGDHGAGQVAKLCNQIVVAATIAAVGEAFLLADKAGVDAAKVRAALLGGFAGSRILDVHGMRMLEKNFKPGFKAELHKKDLKNAIDTARELGLALPATALVTQLMNALVGGGDAQLDSAALVKVLERMSAHTLSHAQK